jgi:hypothetical protein
VASATSSHPVYQTRTTSGEKYHLILRTEQQKSYGLPTGQEVNKLLFEKGIAHLLTCEHDKLPKETIIVFEP